MLKAAPMSVAIWSTRGQGRCQPFPLNLPLVERDSLPWASGISEPRSWVCRECKALATLRVVLRVVLVTLRREVASLTRQRAGFLPLAIKVGIFPSSGLLSYQVTRWVAHPRGALALPLRASGGTGESRDALVTAFALSSQALGL